MSSQSNQEHLQTMSSKVLVIGSGPAAFTAAIYTARAGLDTILLEGLEPGGQLSTTTHVENYPGFAQPILGPDLMQQMKLQAKSCGVSIYSDFISAADFSNEPFVCTTSDNKIYIANSVIVATGASAKWLGLESEQKFMGFGVSSCATCDGFFFKNSKVLVVGGGNSALEEALYLSNHTQNIKIIHRRDSFRGEKIMQDRVEQNKAISVLWNSQLVDVIGKETPRKCVTGAKIRDVVTGKITEIECEGIFVAIGHSPNTSIFKQWLNLDAEGYIITEPESTKTSIEGVFAAGDVRDKIYRQAITAAGSGCMAGIEAAKFMMSKKVS